jgi:hypothetical protein
VVGRGGIKEVERLVRGGVAWAYRLGGGEKREAWWKEREGKKEGMVFWRCCVMSKEGVGSERLALGGGNLVSGALGLNFGR